VKIIIAGDGKVGLSLTQKLSAEGHDLTLIDSNQGVLDSSVERYDVMGVQGNCASMRVLQSADVNKADLLIAATSADEINLLCCMTAHGLNPKIHTIARIRNPEYGKQIFSMRDVYSLSLMVNPEKQSAREIERLIRYPGFLQRDTFAKSRAEIVELRLSKDSRLCNVVLNDLESVVKCKVLVCAVSRDGVVSIPSGHFVLREGDHVFITAPAENLTLLLRNLGVITHKAKRVIICGGGRIGYYLAERLVRDGVTVQVIEQDEARCEELSDRLPPEVYVIHGDASNQFLLESEGIHDCDVLVTMTGIDEMNMIISLYGQTIGVPQVITKVGHLENSVLLDSLGLGSVVCPKELCCNNIVRYVRAMQNTAGAALTLHNIADGQAEALEFVVDAKTRYLGVPLRDMKTKQGILIACISHGSKTEIPSGDSSYREGDFVVVVAKGDMPLLQLNDIFE
jgi:trk system potassium uptake protein TrkA